ncbi:PLP-dependent aminotransferase family protein [Chitinophaga sp. Mgbs1]|uniref:PLP-dependent aminotransferase family protein n=1 Tax=Chitinophaga solisilvae TaxID=1233460 RepID=A0A3S1CWQ9_9BACT|nr:PLP-dependent aminotransferase family protein [Chitinophaga solisilvae]
MSKETSGFVPAGIQLSKEAEAPLYMQLYQQFREKMVRGQLLPGDRVPSSRALAQELGVSRIIVSQCFEQLIMEGYFESRTGSGTYIAAVLPEQLLQVRTAVADPPQETVTDPINGNRIEDVPFQMGLPSLDKFPYGIWQRVGAQVLKTLKHFHLGYEDTLGYRPLRKAISDYLRLARGVDCDASRVVVVTGSQQGLNLTLQTLLQPGDDVWMEDPGYYGARLAFRHAGLNICPVPVQADGMDINYAIQHYPAARLAYVTPTHQFPLGCCMSAVKRRQLLDWAADNNGWILEDDYDSEYRYEGPPTPCLQSQDTQGRVIYSGTFSKVLFPALRLAYIVLPTPEMAEAFRQVKESVDRQSPALEQFILHHFMEQGHFVRHIHKMRLLYAERQRLLAALIQERLHPWLQADSLPAGMHLLCRLHPSVDVQRLKKALRQHRVKVTFVEVFTQQHHHPPALLLGFTAFTAYRLKTAAEKLTACLEYATA